MGLAAKTLKMEEGELGKKGLIKFNISQLVCHLICWLAVAPVLDVYMMGEPWDKLIAQGLMAAFTDFRANRLSDPARAAEARAELQANVDCFGYGYIQQADDLVPPVWLVYWSFRLMVGLGSMMSSRMRSKCS